MAAALHYYRSKGVEKLCGLDDCQGTINICEFLDKLFNALNRKGRNDGEDKAMGIDSPDYGVSDIELLALIE